jgi:hypothetical protein
MGRPEDLSARITAALALGAALPTPALTALLYECTGETCYQRPRLEHQLQRYAQLHPVPLAVATPAPAPVPTSGRFQKKTSLPTPNAVPAPRIMAYKFKPAFADVSTIVHYADRTKEVTAANVTAEDAAAIIAQGQGHLLEQVSDQDAAQAAQNAKPNLSTATSQVVDAEPIVVPVMQTLPAQEGPTDAQRHDAAERIASARQAANEAAISEASPEVTVQIKAEGKNVSADATANTNGRTA